MISIGCALVLAIAMVKTQVFRQPWPKARRLVTDLFISNAISVAIIIAITLALKWTGFFNSEFYRPSNQDFGQHQKLSLTPEDVYFDSEDGTRLHGWFIAAQGDPFGTVIHFHGSDGNISNSVKNSYWLSAYGFNVFAFDYRGYGRSSGEPSRRGVVEDAVAAIDYVRSRTEVDADKICLFGQSLGGQLAIVAADKAGTQGIQAVVADATYASYSNQAKDKMAQLGPLWLLQWAAWLVVSDKYCAKDVVGNLSPTRILLVHGTADSGVQPYHSEWLLNAADGPKDIWRVNGVGHLDVFDSDSYRTRLAQFFKDSLETNATAAQLRDE